jgi:lysophospholipase L1-like esterase
VLLTGSAGNATVCGMYSPYRPCLTALGAAVVLSAHLGAQQPTGHWVGTWGTAKTWRPVTPAAPAPPPPAGQPTPPRPLQFNNQTLRQIVHVSLGGERLRVVFSNTFGTAPLNIGAAAVGLRDKEATLVAGSNRPLTFNGRASSVIPPGATLLSDAVALPFPAASDLAIDLFLPGDTATWTSPLTTHSGAFQTSYVSAAGNHAGEAALTPEARTQSWFLLSRVEVLAPATAGTLVVFGDSITDGTRSTPDTNHRWPDELFRRLQASTATRQIGIVQAAIAGNRLLSEGNPPFGVNALARFDRDVLAVPGAKWVIVLEGINDIGMGPAASRPSAEELIAAHKQLIERAHAEGLKIFGATLLPFEGAAYYSAEGEVKRQAVNAWIRTSRAYDAVIDFDAVTRDKQSPTKLIPAFNSGDNLHPSDAGQGDGRRRRCEDLQVRLRGVGLRACRALTGRAGQPRFYLRQRREEHVAHDLKPARADVVERVVLRVPGGILEVDDVH